MDVQQATGVDATRAHATVDDLHTWVGGYRVRSRPPAYAGSEQAPVAWTLDAGSAPDIGHLRLRPQIHEPGQGFVFIEHELAVDFAEGDSRGEREETLSGETHAFGADDVLTIGIPWGIHPRYEFISLR